MLARAVIVAVLAMLAGLTWGSPLAALGLYTPPVVKYNAHAFAKRSYGSVIAGCHTGARTVGAAVSFIASCLRAPFALGNAGALNIQLLNHGSVELDDNQAEKTVDLDPGMPTSEIRLRVSGTITASATTGSPTINDDTIQRLIPKLRVEYDGNPIVRDIPMRDMHQIWLRHCRQEPTQDIVTASELDGAGNYDFELHTGIPFATRWNARPWDTHLPPIPVKNGLKLKITFSHDRITAASDAKGTGAIVKTRGTDGVFTWNVRPTVEVTQVCHPRQPISGNGAPVGVRHYSQYVTDGWTAAQDPLREPIQSGREFDMHLLRFVSGSTDDLAAAPLTSLCSKISLLSTREQFLNKEKIEHLLAMEAEQFPAANEEAGYLAILYSQGLLSNIVRPGDHENLRYEFTTVAPGGGNTGKIVYTAAEVVRP